MGLENHRQIQIQLAQYAIACDYAVTIFEGSRVQQMMIFRRSGCLMKNSNSMAPLVLAGAAIAMRMSVHNAMGKALEWSIRSSATLAL